MKFFGELTVFEVFVSLIALMTGGYTVYKSFLQRPRVSLFTGESVTLVSPGAGSSDPLHLWVSGVAVNHSARVGVVTPLRVCIDDPQRIQLNGRVTRFVDAKMDPPSFSPAHALSIPPHGSTPFHIVATIEYQEGLPNVWTNGRYHARLEAWVAGNKRSTPNTVKEFAFEVPDVLEMVLGERNGRYTVPTCECAT